MVLLQAIVEIGVDPMPHAAAELRLDRPGIGIVAVSRDPIGDDAGDSPCRSKEALGCGQIAMLTEHYVNQDAIAIDRAVKVLLLAVDPNIRLVDVPATPTLPLRLRRNSSASTGVSFASQSRTAS